MRFQTVGIHGLHPDLDLANEVEIDGPTRDVEDAGLHFADGGRVSVREGVGHEDRVLPLGRGGQ